MLTIVPIQPHQSAEARAVISVVAQRIYAPDKSPAEFLEILLTRSTFWTMWITFSRSMLAAAGCSWLLGGHAVVQICPPARVQIHPTADWSARKARHRLL
jgi:hypothetical protein